MKPLMKLNYFLTFFGGIFFLGLNLKDLSFINGRDISLQVVTVTPSVSKDDCKVILKKQVISNEKIIFILAYYRSGSSFTGSIFQKYPGTFYLFEPIRKIYQMFERGLHASKRILTYVNGTSRQVNSTNGLQVIYEEIDNWLTCNIKEISIESILDNRQLMNSFTECTKAFDADVTGRQLKNCIKEVTLICRTSPIKVIKFVRLKVKYCSVLLNKYPNMKLLHLVRDSRGIFNSRFALGPAKRWLSLVSQQHCKQVAEDLLSSIKLFKSCPNKIRVVTFENIATFPVKTTKRIFNFTGLNISKDILCYLTNQTNADSDSGLFGLRRHSGNMTVNKWRNYLDVRTASKLYNDCRKSNIFLGYFQLSTLQLLRNHSVPSRNFSYHSEGIIV